MKRLVQIGVMLVLFGVTGCRMLPKAPIRFRAFHFNTQKAEEETAYYPEASLPYVYSWTGPEKPVNRPPYNGPVKPTEKPLGNTTVKIPVGILEKAIDGVVAIFDKVFSLVGRLEILTLEKGGEPFE